MRSGFVAARVRGAGVIVTLDGDGQHDPEDIPAVLAAAAAAPDAIVIGGRLRAEAELPVGRLNAIRVAGFFLTWVTGQRIADTQSGFRAYPAALFETVVLRRGGFVLETEVLVVAAAHGVPVHEVPVAIRPRIGQRSRFRPVVDGVAIGAYLAGRSLARWAHEGAAAGRTVASIFHGDRLAARHAAMLQAARAHESPALAAFAVGAVAGQRATDRLAGWWRHPRRRRASAVASGMMAAPVLLVLAAAQTVAGRRAPDLVTPLVERVYASDRLHVTASDSVRPLAAPPALPS